MLFRAETARAIVAAACLWAVLAAPPVSAWLESSMALHMLVQLPLLAAIGWCIGSAWLRSHPAGAGVRALRLVQSFNAGGITGILAASFAMVMWMLPRLLDLARLDGMADAVKFVTVPAAGVAVALSWPRLPAIARAVVHLEVIATLLRFGWGYLAADGRLCLAYLANDQRLTGILLVCLGAAYAVVAAWQPMFGGAPRARPA